ncbi:MAG: alpha/beta fold hydrolase [Dehalococcoidia bacterium]
MFEFAEINGHRLRYRLQGAGPLVVFGHGLMGNIEQVTPPGLNLDAVHQRVRLLTYDARGHGQSLGPEDHLQYTWETLGRDMSAFIDHAGETSAIIGGASMGAATALWLAVEQPERVKALAILMPPPLGGPEFQRPDEKNAIAFLDMLSMAIQATGIERTLEFAKSMPGFAATPEEAEERANWLRSQNPLTLMYAIRGLVQSQFHHPDDYARITAPTIVVAHGGDGLHPVRAAELLAEKIPNAELVVSPTPGYWQANPGEFLALMMDWLERVGAEGETKVGQ